jgi:hypothetical protein
MVTHCTFTDGQIGFKLTGNGFSKEDEAALGAAVAGCVGVAWIKFSKRETSRVACGVTGDTMPDTEKRERRAPVSAGRKPEAARTQLPTAIFLRR